VSGANNALTEGFSWHSADVC